MIRKWASGVSGARRARAREKFANDSTPHFKQTVSYTVATGSPPCWSRHSSVLYLHSAMEPETIVIDDDDDDDCCITPAEPVLPPFATVAPTTAVAPRDWDESDSEAASSSYSRAGAKPAAAAAAAAASTTTRGGDTPLPRGPPSSGAVEKAASVAVAVPVYSFRAPSAAAASVAAPAASAGGVPRKEIDCSCCYNECFEGGDDSASLCNRGAHVVCIGCFKRNFSDAGGQGKQPICCYCIADYKAGKHPLDSVLLDCTAAERFLHVQEREAAAAAAISISSASAADAGADADPDAAAAAAASRLSVGIIERVAAKIAKEVMVQGMPAYTLFPCSSCESFIMIEKKKLAVLKEVAEGLEKRRLSGGPPGGFPLAGAAHAGARNAVAQRRAATERDTAKQRGALREQLAAAKLSLQDAQQSVIEARAAELKAATAPPPYRGATNATAVKQAKERTGSAVAALNFAQFAVEKLEGKLNPKPAAAAAVAAPPKPAPAAAAPATTAAAATAASPTKKRARQAEPPVGCLTCPACDAATCVLCEKGPHPAASCYAGDENAADLGGDAVHCSNSGCRLPMVHFKFDGWVWAIYYSCLSTLVIGGLFDCIVESTFA